jgi:uncharacterized membrane protein (DUF4010 family)
MIPPADVATIVDLAVAGLVGLAVGIEREWSGHASGPGARFAGVRTFLLLGLLGGIAGWLLAGGEPAAAVVLLAGAVALPIAAYVAASRPGGDTVDGTTEAAALLVVALGALAGMGEIRLAGGIAALAAFALNEKARVRRILPRVGEEEMRAAVQFAVLALVILPLLPDRSYGPLGGIHPRSLWVVVLLFSGLSFAGYVARKVVGQARGYALTGLLGGLVSSTAVTLHFSRKSRTEPELGRALALGVIGACTVVFPRVGLVSAILNPIVALALLPYLVAPFLAGAALAAVGSLRSTGRDETSEVPGTRNPLRLWSSIQMALAFQVVLMAVAWMRQTWGASGVMASAAVLGLTDTDALTLSMNRLGERPEAVPLAAAAIGAGILANTLFKLGLALALGAGVFRRVVAAGLLLLLAATAAGFWLGGGLDQVL